jgi:hypothetical protein
LESGGGGTTWPRRADDGGRLKLESSGIVFKIWRATEFEQVSCLKEGQMLRTAAKMDVAISLLLFIQRDVSELGPFGTLVAINSCLSFLAWPDRKWTSSGR